MSLSIKEIKKRVDKLKLLNKELEKFDGFAIRITRLTILKYLCRDRLAMCDYALMIAKKTKPRIEYKENEEDIKKVVNLSLKLMTILIKKTKEINILEIDEEDNRQMRYNRQIG